jgi:hypothetical protein
LFKVAWARRSAHQSLGCYRNLCIDFGFVVGNKTNPQYLIVNSQEELDSSDRNTSGKNRYVIVNALGLALVLILIKILYKLLVSFFFGDLDLSLSNPVLRKYAGFDLFFDFLAYTVISLMLFSRLWHRRIGKQS